MSPTGARGGTATPQVYLSFPPAAGEPPKRLVGWQRVTLAPGESQTVSITGAAILVTELDGIIQLNTTYADGKPYIVQWPADNPAELKHLAS